MGPGRAGRARIRALESHAQARLAAVVARNGSPGLESVLADPAIDAVILCTPDLLHASAARAALGAGKHVAVEYPLASGAAEGRELFELAEAAGRVLHAEHIELLSPSQARLRERARELGRPRGGSLRSSGSSAGWSGDPRLGGAPALRAVARLHRLVDLFGPARASAARLERSADGGFRLETELAFAAGGEVRLLEERAPGLARKLAWDIRCERGVLEDPGAAASRGLFALDLDCFVERIRSGAPPYVSPERILHVLALVDQIGRGL